MRRRDARSSSFSSQQKMVYTGIGMLDSACEVLKHYIDGNVSRFTVYSIEMERGENGEDVYYLCRLKDGWYVVFESDFIDTLEYVAKEASELFDVEPTGWCVKKLDQRDGAGLAPLT